MPPTLSGGAPVELFEDQGQTFLYAGANQGLSVGSQVVIVGQRIGNTAERRRVGMATVMEVWPSIARVHLDEAAQAEPQNAQVWTTRGLAYERLGEKTKAAGSFARAINLRPRDETARAGFARVGGKPGQSYE